MAVMRNYVCMMEHGGGFGGGYGGTYATEFYYTSSHRANSKGNMHDAENQYRRTYGKAGWCEAVKGSACLVND